MRKKTLVLTCISLAVLVFSWFGASRFVVAQAIAPPNASTRTLLAMVLFPPKFAMVTPHRNLYTVIKTKIQPTSVLACGSLPCTGYESKSFCGQGDCYTPCQGGFCYCPGCQQTPGCTVYCCKYTGQRRTCAETGGQGVCSSCADATTSSGCTGTPPPE
jgi:hypothetical protein